MTMIRVHVFCEGQTEETFVREVLYKHFISKQISLNPIIIRTGPQGRGGAVSYGKIKHQIETQCQEDPSAWVTTMLDFYGLPSDFPDMNRESNAMTRADVIQQAFQQDIVHRNFLANLIVHEFEGLLFSNPSAFGQWFDESKVESLHNVRKEYNTPEDINDSSDTAPSKRILNTCQGYEKVLHGPLIALDIGLDIIRRECPLFDVWIQRLEALPTGVSHP